MAISYMFHYLNNSFENFQMKFKKIKIQDDMHKLMIPKLHTTIPRALRNAIIYTVSHRFLNTSKIVITT